METICYDRDALMDELQIYQPAPYSAEVIAYTLQDLSTFKDIMEFILNTPWKYDDIKDIVHLRAKMTSAVTHNDIHENFMPMMDYVWNLLVRLGNLYLFVRPWKRG